MALLGYESHCYVCQRPFEIAFGVSEWAALYLQGAFFWNMYQRNVISVGQDTGPLNSITVLH